MIIERQVTEWIYECDVCHSIETKQSFIPEMFLPECSLGRVGKGWSKLEINEVQDDCHYLCPPSEKTVQLDICSRCLKSVIEILDVKFHLRETMIYRKKNAEVQ